MDPPTGTNLRSQNYLAQLKTGGYTNSVAQFTDLYSFLQKSMPSFKVNG